MIKTELVAWQNTPWYRGLRVKSLAKQRQTRRKQASKRQSAEKQSNNAGDSANSQASRADKPGEPAKQGKAGHQNSPVVTKPANDPTTQEMKGLV